MRRTFFVFLCLGITASIVLSPVIGARDIPCEDVAKTAAFTSSVDIPILTPSCHSVGNIVMCVSNFGDWGQWSGSVIDYLTGETHQVSSEYPKWSLIHNLMHGAFWVGGVQGSDTLVSMSYGDFSGYEFTSYEPIKTLSIDNQDPSSSEMPVSEQDFYAVMNDTLVESNPYLLFPDYLRGTSHKPLHVEITQKSYAWSSAITDDFILFDLSVKNIGNEMIEDAYFGVLTRPMVGFDIDINT